MNAPKAGIPATRAAAGADTRQWSWWAARGSDPETFFLNEASRDAVIAAARREYTDSPIVFTIVEATQDGPFDADIFDDDDLMERIWDRFGDVNSSRFGEDGFENAPGESAEAQLAKMLGEAFAAWLAQHGDTIPTFAFTAQRHRETISEAAPGIVTAEIVASLKERAMSTEQVIGHIGLVVTIGLIDKVANELNALGFERRPFGRPFEDERFLWFPRGLSEQDAIARADAAIGSRP